MRLDCISISGYRGYGDLIEIAIDPATTTIIGRNDAGKSSVFEALDIFFGGSKLELSDFSVGVDAAVEIGCTFSDLPVDVVLDESHSTNLKSEYLLDRSDRLTLVKSWSRSRLTTPTLAARAMHPHFSDESDPLNAKITALKTMATSLGIEDGDIEDRRTSSSFREAIWRTAIANGSATIEELLIPLSSEDGKAVGAALGQYLPLFHLFRADRQGTEADKVAQDPASAAIKAVLDEHEEQLTQLSLVVQRQVTELLADVVARLAEVAPSLAASLTPTDPSPVWSKAFSNLQFVDENGIPLAKRGSGTRRLVLLSFFRAQAERGLELVDEPSDSYRRGVITAVEEPETALHADLQTDIVSALQDIGELPHRQVLLTTHSSNLIRLVPVDSIRYIKRSGQARLCVQAHDVDDASELLNELNASLGVFTDHNVRCFILVEGRNDVIGLKLLSAALSQAGVAGVLELEDLESKGLICFLPIGGGGSASLWNSNLSPFKRPEVHIMDSDRDSPMAPLKPEITALLARADHSRFVSVLDRRELENYLTPDAVNGVYVDIPGFASTFLALCSAGDWNYLDIPSLCAEAAHTLGSPSGVPWAGLPVESQKSKESRAKKRLAGAFAHPTVSAEIASASPDLLLALKKVCELAVA